MKIFLVCIKKKVFIIKFVHISPHVGESETPHLVPTPKEKIQSNHSYELMASRRARAVQEKSMNENSSK